MAADRTLPESAERQRLDSAGSRYAAHLQRLLGPAPTQRKSSLDLTPERTASGTILL
jgi:hypothetical protein